MTASATACISETSRAAAHILETWESTGSPKLPARQSPPDSTYEAERQELLESIVEQMAHAGCPRHEELSVCLRLLRHLAQ